MITKLTFYNPFSESSSTANGTPNSRIRCRNLFGALFTVLLGLLAAVPAAQAGINLKAIGLTQDGVLVRLTTGFGSTQDIGFITFQGGGTDTSLIGIDFRVQDGLLYGVGDAGGLYTINTQNAVATPVMDPVVGSRLDILPMGDNFGVDFNPAANALRIVSDTGQNLRHPFATGVTANDGILTYTVPSVPPALPVTPVAATGVTAAAYTNNDLAASTGTTLFDIDTATPAPPPPPAVDPQDVVVVQSPANAGTLVPTGSLGVDAGPQAGFDIFSRLGNGVAVANFGFASLFVNGKYRLHEINLLTGKATAVGNAFDEQIVDLAIRLKQ